MNGKCKETTKKLYLQVCYILGRLCATLFKDHLRDAVEEEGLQVFDAVAKGYKG